MIDPMNNIMGLKVPLFLLYIISLSLCYKPDYKYLPILMSLSILQVVSYCSGLLDGRVFNNNMTIQYFMFFLLFIILLWRKYIDIWGPIVLSSVIVSIITIVGFIAMTAFPNLFEAIYAWSGTYDYVIIIAKRTFLGIEFNQIFYKSIPVVILPAAYYTNKFVYERDNKIKNFFFVCLFLFSLFCSGNRGLMGALFFVVFFISYNKVSKMKVFVPIMVLLFIVAIYILFLAITDTAEASADIKKGHLLSYFDYFSEKWYLLLFGSGAGSLFYTQDYGMTGITEMTYFELIRMYGIIGLFYIMYFFIIPLLNYKSKAIMVYNWKPLSISYIIYLLISGSNPYLISSSGFICALLMFTIISNPKFLKCYENKTKGRGCYSNVNI